MSEEDRRLRAASRGDRHALEELIRALYPSVFRFLHGMLGDTDQAEDAMQEAFVRMARALDGYDGRTGARAWSIGIARRVAADHASGVGEGPFLALASVPHELREVLVLRDLLGWPLDEVADILMLDAAGARAMLDAARETLVRSAVPHAG